MLMCRSIGLVDIIHTQYSVVSQCECAPCVSPDAFAVVVRVIRTEKQKEHRDSIYSIRDTKNLCAFVVLLPEL